MTLTPTMILSQTKCVFSVKKSWKHDFRNACLMRIRADKWKTPEKVHGSCVRPVRSIIEDEMRRNGVFLESPCSDSDSQMNRLITNGGAEPMDDTPTNDDSVPTANHFITEDELFELLEELEDEMKKNETACYDEMIDMAQKDFEDQIADFELWESNQSNSFLCPICCSANLVTVPSGVLLCPNQPDCPMIIDNLQNLTWDEVRNRLKLLFDDHSVIYEDQFLSLLAQHATSHSDL